MSKLGDFFVMTRKERLGSLILIALLFAALAVLAVVRNVDFVEPSANIPVAVEHAATGAEVDSLKSEKARKPKKSKTKKNKKTAKPVEDRPIRELPRIAPER